MNDTTAPTVEGLLTPDGHHIVIPCPYCGNWHRHGAVRPEIGAGDGHRVASDCPDRPPLSNPGYIIKTIGRATEPMMKKIRLKRPLSRPSTASEALLIA